MILTRTKYETYDIELLTIIKTFKTWRHYLEDSQHEAPMLTDHNNLRQFINMKSLSSRQVCKAQKLSYYYFQLDYCQNKANRITNALSWYPQ